MVEFAMTSLQGDQAFKGTWESPSVLCRPLLKTEDTQELGGCFADCGAAIRAIASQKLYALSIDIQPRYSDSCSTVDVGTRCGLAGRII